MKVEPGNILKLFLNFSNFELQYSYRLYSYKKKECTCNQKYSATPKILGKFSTSAPLIFHENHKRVTSDATSVSKSFLAGVFSDGGHSYYSPIFGER